MDSDSEGPAPLVFFYTHLHDAIRSELGALSQSVAQLEGSVCGERQIEAQLAHLRDRYRFLGQVYKYHSSVEDEVVYPALDAKVKNVTLAYSVEHEDEEHLLDELSAMLSGAAAAAPGATAPAVRTLSRKVEEVHTTLRKHLAKEEEQLLPLLLRHFSFREQAALVAQFLCCIPIAAVVPVLGWLKQSVPVGEQASLLRQVQEAVPDKLLRQVLLSWLNPVAAAPLDATEPGTPDAASEFVCCGCARGASPAATEHSAAGEGGCRVDRDLEDAGYAVGKKPPLREILYFHHAIRSALQSFAEEARAVRAAAGSLGPAQLTALVERHRFIRAVCLFHSASEDDVVFPALRRLAARQQQQQAGPAAQGQRHSGAGDPPEAGTEAPGAQLAAPAGRHRFEDDHVRESAQFEELGRLLGDVKACARRGSAQVAALVGDLSGVADRLARAMGRHMGREESEVLPVLMRSLCPAEQRHMVWRCLRAMPLRLLERVMPWVAGKLRDDDVEEWLANIRQAAPPHEAALVGLLSRWARRGAAAPAAEGPVCSQLGEAALRRSSDDPADYGNQTCGPLGAVPAASAPPPPPTQVAAHARPLKRIRTEAAGRGGRAAAEPAASGGAAGVRAPVHPAPPPATSPVCFADVDGAANPIDHIFQFHKALRRELKDLESSAIQLQAAADDAGAWAPGDGLDSAIQALQARFQFLRGIYRAHSHAEDEIVFPALEAKETLHNVSHAYTLDHKQEEALLQGVADVIRALGERLSAGRSLPDLRALASRLARMCAAVRASLETHVRAEEKELWPLFAEHFSTEEQEHLVGVIIGRTGAEVLHTMLSWVRGSLTQEETEAMMLSMKSASKSTAFAQWLGAALDDDCGNSGGGGASRQAAARHAAGGLSLHDEQQEVLSEVAAYLASSGPGGGASSGDNPAALPAPAGPADPASVAADASRFRPGWEDIFRMNQKQLEGAVRRVSADASLEPQRKAYLIQHLMASRYVVAQQRRMAASSQGATPTAAAAASRGGAEVAAAPRDTAERPRTEEHEPQHREPPPLQPPQPQQQPQQPAVPPHRHYHDHGSGPLLGCRHYRRRAMLVAPCCGGEFVCRLCHDEATPGHQMDRQAVAEMVCMECGARQAVGAACAACEAPMARYYCAICHLFDDDPHHDIYHCPFCNFCRRGKGLGVDSFHCMSCNACMSLELFNRHRCVERALGGTCPVCSDPLFHSASPIKELPCGHFMHSLCFAAYTRYSYTCPLCAKSLGDMSVYWKMIDALLAAERLPPEYAARRQAVGCNDCGADTNAPFHFVYHKCGGCGGYNTRLV